MTIMAILDFSFSFRNPMLLLSFLVWVACCIVSQRVNWSKPPVMGGEIPRPTFVASQHHRVPCFL